MPDRDEIQCRARVDAACFHGRTIAEVHLSDVFDEGAGGWRDDGTYLCAIRSVELGGDVRAESIVCDACYVTLMPYSASRQLLLAEIPAAIAAYREKHPTIPGTT